MRNAVTCMSHRRYPRALASFVLAAAAPVAMAQSANCEAFKERLASSIESNGVRGYALEVVPSGSPAPLGARSLGTCDGGAYTVLYWRWAQARGEAATAPPPSVTDATSATPQAPKSDAEPMSRREPKAMSEVNAEREPNATHESKPSRGATAGREPHSAATSRPSPANPSAAPAVTDATNQQPVASPAPTEPTAAPSPASTSAKGAEPASFAGLARVVALVVAAAAVIVGGVWAWRWMRNRRYYDEAGLPRGPRITLR
jgi:hypothetical protein